MPTWGEILQEFNSPSANPDLIRRSYLQKLAEKTQRDTILYATKWTNPGAIAPDLLSITEEDLQGFMEVISGLRNKNLDLILHSPGGSIEATEAIVKYLRQKFSHVRVIIPHAAMSAGTMLSCSANQILMGKHSFLGPIDPQFILQTPLGVRMVPAQAILDQFKLAQEQCKDASRLGTWLPILSQYGPGLLVECQNALKLSEHLVKEWLTKYMFGDTAPGRLKSKNIAIKLAAHKDHMSHARHLNRDDCKALGLNIDDLESDQTVQDLVLSVYHACTITLMLTTGAKIIENHNGKAFVKLAGVVPIQPPSRPPPVQQSTPTQPQAPSQQN